MSISQSVRNYWPVIVITGAITTGLPALTGHIDSRPGLAGITGRANESDDPMVEPARHAGFTRAPGALPVYGLDGIRLDTPIFPSWWDGKPVEAASKLHEIGSNAVALGPIWKDSLSFHDIVARMHGAGVRVMIEVTSEDDWVTLRDDGMGRGLQPVANTFVSGRAERVLAEARKQGVGTFADFIMIGGDAMSYANQLQRQKIYQLAKQAFPDKPIVRRYSFGLDRAEALVGRPHPMGGTWADYRFGPDECDVALVSVGRGVDEGRAGVRVNVALEQLNHIVSIVKSRHPDAGIIVTTSLGDERVLANNKSAMWSTKEIDQFVSAMLTSAGVDGLMIEGMGLYAYDLGYPDFGPQRQALRDAAPHLSPDELLAQEVQIDRRVASDPAPQGGLSGWLVRHLYGNPSP